MDRRTEQTQLLLGIGMAFGPMVRAAEFPSEVPLDEQKRVLGRFCSDMAQFEGAARMFTHGETGCIHSAEFREIHSHTHKMQHTLNFSMFGETSFLDFLNETQHELHRIISSVPVRDSKEIFDAESPFAAHLHFRNLCSTVGQELQWQDRYFDQSVFDRYLTLVPSSARITLVTWPRSKCKGKRDESRYDAFMDISKLFAVDRGQHRCVLITNEDFHARWLRCDDRLYTHDDSIKALGEDRSFTIAKLPSTPENRKHVDDEASGGTELFGPSQATHL